MGVGVCSLSELQQQVRDSRAEVAGNKAVIAVLEANLVSVLTSNDACINASICCWFGAVPALM